MKPTKQIHQQLIDLCKKNDAKAQMQLYKLYCNAMLIVAHRYVKDRFIAEDIMQDAFIKAFRKIECYKNEVSFGAWLKRIVINQSIDHLKKNKLELVSINEEVYKKEDEQDWQVECTISVEGIVNVIKSLKEKYRLVLSLYLLEGYDVVGWLESTISTGLMASYNDKILEKINGPSTTERAVPWS